jgi:hypothetical protein
MGKSNGLGTRKHPEAVSSPLKTPHSPLPHSCAGSGSIVSGFTGTCTSSR